jgi:hypothetical protein
MSTRVLSVVSEAGLAGGFALRLNRQGVGADGQSWKHKVSAGPGGEVASGSAFVE